MIKVSDLRICLGSFSEATELSDEMTTLFDYGIKGETQSLSISPDGTRTGNVFLRIKFIIIFVILSRTVILF